MIYLDSWYGHAEPFLLLFWNSGTTAKTNEDAHAEQGIKVCSNSPQFLCTLTHKYLKGTLPIK